MSNDKMREAFVVWHIHEFDEMGHPDDYYRLNSYGEFVEVAVQHDWETWQAALTQQPGRSEPASQWPESWQVKPEGEPALSSQQPESDRACCMQTPCVRPGVGPCDRPAPKQSKSDSATGIEAAAKWIENRRDAYIAEHGSYDPDTGATEYPGDGAEYLSELDDIAEGIRSLCPQPSAQVPDRITIKQAQERLRTPSVGHAKHYARGWNECAQSFAPSIAEKDE